MGTRQYSDPHRPDRCLPFHAEVEGYAGQNLIECSSKRDLQLPVGESDKREDTDDWEALHEAHKTIGAKYGSEVRVVSCVFSLHNTGQQD